ncbi:hypothetical protein BASA81_010222 [Batrachochytrium salamandrivorans]|nr:hypothetical protein BASA81_010222 [Batrachochytrium salamandrivorans]
MAAPDDQLTLDDDTSQPFINIKDEFKSPSGPTHIPLLTPPKSFVPPTIPPLSPLHSDILAEFRSYVDAGLAIPASFEPKSACYDRAVAYCTTPCLRRYLTSHKWVLDSAKRGLHDTLLWREEYRPDAITAEEVTSEAMAGNAYINGLDKEGRPILYIRKRGKLGNPELNIRLIIHILENAIRIMPEGVERVSMILDFTNYTRANSPPVSISRTMMRFIISHYPDRMGVAFFVNTPWVFGLLWNVIGHFLDPSTTANIHFVKHNHDKPLVDDTMETSISATPKPIMEAKVNGSTPSLPTTTSSWSLFPFGKSSPNLTTENVTSTDGLRITSVISEDVLELGYGGTYNYVYNHIK